MFHFSHSAVIITVKINSDLCLYKSLSFHHLYPSATFHFNGRPLLLRTFKLQLYMASGLFYISHFHFSLCHWQHFISYLPRKWHWKCKYFRAPSDLSKAGCSQAGPVFPFSCFPATFLIYSVVQQTQSSLVDSFGIMLAQAITWIGQKVHLSFHAHIEIMNELFGQPSTCFKMISN